ncbi:2-phospho-L-lactate guanylyltransferase [Sphingobium sp. OAS761]|uniref:2-phospho-L-lactate guanylyltransferase n=1 Tax=Sphingobium sp. OAS761 TaxID=2817901 RepID=UPI00209F5DC0|nr:2-phospho-L-lactate guanylyltransferase [Sphingobium sp. OAS761]MCP1470361.1 2-phospho-L-lactate guanylyltransferase [Sphingobium sp. OAS761]
MPWTLIPAKDFRLAKQRLAPVLGTHQRADLARTLLRHTIGIAQSAFDEPVLVVTPDSEVASWARDCGADDIILSEAGDLNAELKGAARQVPTLSDLLVLHADLPFLTAAELRALAQREQTVLIGCDRSGKGTNALLLRGRHRFFAFGPGSCAHHLAQANARGLSRRVIRLKGLSRDMDTPGDWACSGNMKNPPVALHARCSSL